MFNISNNPSKFLFVPLGGSGEIGMNVNLYHYNGEWIMVDLGVGFAEEDMPGVDIMAPDLDFILKYRKNLRAIVLTHAHEDHYGAVPLLWEELRCPVYATKFTAGCLKAKLAYYSLANVVPIREIPENSSFKIGSFELEYINLTHSIPEMNALSIKTDKGLVLHTGDWKFDDKPVVGKKSNMERLEKLGQQEVCAMVCDSTNVFSDGWSGCEGDLHNNFVDIMKNTTGLVACALFASNVARIQTIIDSAIEAGRKVVICGRALQRIIGVAQDCGYLAGRETHMIMDPRDASESDRNRLALLCTGCQGEVLAAMNRLANNDFMGSVKLRKGDTVVFSSKIIPGNERRIHRLYNKLALSDIEIVTDSPKTRVHVSGHPCRDELKKIYEVVRPKVAIPVHGEHAHIMEHAKMAPKWGAGSSIRVKNGDVVEIEKGEASIAGSVRSGRFGVDMNVLHHPDGDVMKMRRIMSQGGLFFAVVVVNRKLELLQSPSIFAPGVLDARLDSDVIESISKEVIAGFTRSRPETISTASRLVKSCIRNICRAEINKEPYVHVQVEMI